MLTNRRQDLEERPPHVQSVMGARAKDETTVLICIQMLRQAEKEFRFGINGFPRIPYEFSLVGV